MATPFDATPKWFDANFYLEAKLAMLIEADPKGNWTRPSLLEAFKAAGIDNPYDHYLAYGDMEGLSPNPLFNNTEYLAAKTAAMGSTWTTEMVAKAIADAGLTLMQHYEKYGSVYENLSPSSAFNQNKYYEAKLDLLQMAEPDKGWTLDALKADFAAAGLTPLDHYLAYAKIEGLDKFDYSDNGAPIPHPGNQITLTTGADIATPDATVEGFKTSSRDDVISGVASGSKSTLNAGDVIDGGAGVDTLKVDMKGSGFAFGSKGGSVKNVEFVELANADGKTFDAKGVEKVTAYTVDSAKNTVTITNVDSADTDYVLTKEAGALKVTIANEALAGKTDNVSVKLKGVGLEDAPVAVSVSGVTSGNLETLTLVAEGANSYVKVDSKHDTVAVEGAGNIEIEGVAAGLKAFNASAATGKIDADLSKASASLKTVTGGVGDDIIVVGAPATGATFTGGDGNDTLEFDGLANNTLIKAAISEFETFMFADASGSSVVNVKINATAITDVETIQYTTSKDAVVADDTLTITGASAWNELTFAIDSEVGASTGTFTYDGTGVLNISAYGEETAGTKFKSVTAAAVDTVNISNTSEGSFELTNLVINKATTLNVNTGGQTFTYTDANHDAHAALQYVNLSGGGDAVITLGSGSKALEEVNAGELTGELTLDLSGVATSKGVTVNMGNYGASGGLTGTAKADTFNLGNGAEKVVLDGATGSAADTINGFRDSGADTIEGLVAADLTVHSVKIALTAANYAFIDDVADATKIDKDAIASYFSKVASGTITGYALFTDAGDTVGIYRVVADTTEVKSVTLVGILTDTDIATLTVGMFV